jgi:hypothetical protein
MASRSRVDEFGRLPSAILTEGPLTVFLFVVTRMTLSERYTLPPIGSHGYRAAVDNSSDSVSLSALLIGSQRFLWKQDLELMADSSKRGGTLGKLTGGLLGGLTLISRMTTRINMQVTELSFTASAQRLDTLEVSIALQHVPRPGPANLLVDVGMAAAMTVVEFAT